MEYLKRFAHQNPILNAIRFRIRHPDYKVSVTNSHLGGYKLEGDSATEVTPLWEYAYQELGCRSVLDVGCGAGMAMKIMHDIGYEVNGIDGLADVKNGSVFADRIQIQDLTRRPYLAGRQFDFVWCSEVVEHIEERFVGNVILTLKGHCQRYLGMTYAAPGSYGYHHVNLQPEEYWIAHLEFAGLKFDPELTASMRQLVKEKSTQYKHFAKTGLMFYNPMSVAR